MKSNSVSLPGIMLPFMPMVFPASLMIVKNSIRLLKILIETHEAQFENPWPFQLPDDYLQKMIRGIVGFEIEITRLEGKFKMSQNRTESEREIVIAALQESPDTQPVAELMNKEEVTCICNSCISCNGYYRKSWFFHLARTKFEHTFEC